MVIEIFLEPSDDGGYTATVPVLPGCISEGDSVQDAMINIREAAELDLEPLDDVHGPAGAIVQELSL